MIDWRSTRHCGKNAGQGVETIGILQTMKSIRPLIEILLVILEHLWVNEQVDTQTRVLRYYSNIFPVTSGNSFAQHVNVQTDL